MNSATAPSVCVCVPTAPGLCALGWVKYREHISLLVILRIIVYVTQCFFLVFVFYRYPIMVKCLNIGKNIGKPIYIDRSLVLNVLLINKLNTISFIVVYVYKSMFCLGRHTNLHCQCFHMKSFIDLFNSF